jgi:hypothetical protein
MLMLGWPLIGMAAAAPWFVGQTRVSDTAGALMIVSFLAAFANAPIMLIPAAFRPPAFIANESAELADRRRRLTLALTIMLGLLLPIILFGSCLYSILPPH